MFDCRLDERTFWRTMTPARLHALYRAYFRSHGRRARLDPVGALPAQNRLAQNVGGNQDPPGLADYFRGRL